MTRQEWYEVAATFITQHLDYVYEKLYGDGFRLEPAGKNIRINPCPICGHHDCCTINDNSVHCFSGSCDVNCSHINLWIRYCEEKKNISKGKAIELLADVIGTPYPALSPEEQAKAEQAKRRQDIMQKMEDILHEQLLKCRLHFVYDEEEYTPMEYLLRVRHRKEETIRRLKWGFVADYQQMMTKLYTAGYIRQEIEDAVKWLPEGVFVFFYHNYATGAIVRINTKNPFEIHFKDKFDENGDLEKEGRLIKGYSIGLKTLYCPPDFHPSEPVIIVEGEHDMAAVMEKGWNNVVCCGGTINETMLRMIDDLPGDKYMFFDNDEAGAKYEEELDSYMADKPLFRIQYDVANKDPDEYFVYNPSALSPQELMQHAEQLPESGYRIRHYGNVWSIGTRSMRLEFIIEKKDEKGLSGVISYYQNGELVDRDDRKVLSKAKAAYRPLNFHLQDAITQYFDENLDTKSIDELASIYWFSNRKTEIIKLISLAMSQSDDVEAIVGILRRRLGNSPENNETVIDTILMELNDITNQSAAVNFGEIKKSCICQFFNTKHQKAYFYYTEFKQDSDGTMKKIPYLIRNDKKKIRLDLIKRKDPQCMLIIDNIWELPCEVPCAIGNADELSLDPAWVNKWISDQVPPEEITPSHVIRELETYVRRFYYFSDQRCYKVISLWIYMTYFYMLFSAMPYLYLNGEKGSGKSTLDGIIHGFAFNAKFAVDISDAALFRMISMEGGTMIMDEVENLTTRAKSQDSSMASVLKGGYSKTGKVYRTNMDAGGIAEGFDIYGPKVISNIFGVDDVIEDRCVQIKTQKIKMTKEIKPEEYDLWEQRNPEARKSLTSRMVLSVLEHFMLLAEIHNSTFIEASTARLGQIMRPLFDIARLVDYEERQSFLTQNPGASEDDITCEYEKALREYHDDVLSFLKESVDEATPEGIIKTAVRGIAAELLGLVPEDEREYTNAKSHKYSKPIVFDEQTYSFKVDGFHIKCFVEEALPDNTAYSMRNNSLMSRCFPLKKGDTSRTWTTLTNKDLINEFNGNAKQKVTVWTIRIPEAFPDLMEERARMDEEEEQTRQSTLTEDDLLTF